MLYCLLLSRKLAVIFKAMHSSKRFGIWYNFAKLYSLSREKKNISVHFRHQSKGQKSCRWSKENPKNWVESFKNVPEYTGNMSKMSKISRFWTYVESFGSFGFGFGFDILFPSKVQYIFEKNLTVKSQTMSKYQESQKAEFF